MKKLTTVLAIIVFAFTTQAQNTKGEKDLKALMTTVEEMTQMLTNDYTQVMSALDAVSGTTFSMGECMVLTGVTDDAFKKQCKQVEKELGAGLNNSTWSFEKYNRASQCNVNLKLKDGKAESAPYNGFEGRATISIQSLIEGLTIDSYWYQSKTDKNKYIMSFSDKGMSFFFDMTKKAAGSSKAATKTNATEEATASTPAKATTTTSGTTTAPVAPTINTDNLKNKAKTKLLKKVKL